MVLPILESVIGVAITGVLAFAAVYAGAFTPVAGAVAALFGAVIVVTAGFGFLGLLILFVVGSSLATRYGFQEKEKAHLSEGKHGERGVSNVLAHVVVPTVLALGTVLVPASLPLPLAEVLFAAALAFGAADTFASEFGVLSGHARSILTLRTVPSGTNGGVSGIGELWAAAGALLTGILGVLLFLAFHYPLPSAALLVGAASVAGFISCQIDSILGETLENRGFLTKHGTNLLGMLSSVLIAGAAVYVGGGL